MLSDEAENTGENDFDSEQNMDENDEDSDLASFAVWFMLSTSSRMIFAKAQGVRSFKKGQLWLRVGNPLVIRSTFRVTIYFTNFYEKDLLFC